MLNVSSFLKFQRDVTIYIESIVKFQITKHVRKVAGLWRSDIYQQLISPGDILSWLDNGLLTL